MSEATPLSTSLLQPFVAPMLETCFKTQPDVSDFNDATSTGMYLINQGKPIANSPAPAMYGILKVYSYGAMILQIAAMSYSAGGGALPEIYTRLKWSLDNTWGSWVKILTST